jgi:uncharacterized protein (TIGR03086 family)
MRPARRPAQDARMTESHQRDTGAASITELIALGRDREAVEAATRRSETIERGDPMDGVQQLDEIMPQLEALVDGIRPDQLDDPTPCASFTVSSVLEHMIAGATAFAPAFRGEAAPPAAADAGEGTTTERWRRAMAELTSAVHAPGAQDRTVAAPFGEVPGSVFARFVAFDGLVHGWDLAVATGQPYAPRPDLVAEVDGFAREALKPEMRDGDTFAAENQARPDASPLERLVAFTGRRVPTTGAQR